MSDVQKGTMRLKTGLAEMLKGGVIMDVVDAEQAVLAQEAGAVAVMALERVPADIRAQGGVARMSDPAKIKEIQAAVSIPVMAKCRIGHFAEAQVLQALGVDYIDESEKYDFVVDAVGTSTFGKCKPLLTKNGIYSSSGGPDLFLVLITPILGGKKFVFAPPKNLQASLSFIKGLIEKGSFRAVIDRRYPIDKIAEAYKYVATGEKIGNVIITMDA